MAVAFLGGLNAPRINQSPKKKKTYLIVVFGMMILFAVLRGYNVGIDYSNRVDQMELLRHMSFKEMTAYSESTMHGQDLYVSLVWLGLQVFRAPWFVNGLMDVFVLSVFGWFFYRYSKDVTIATPMFLVTTFAATMNITRQYIAAALFLIALHFLMQKHPVKAAIPLALAALSHSSAFILFLFYIIYFIGFRCSKKKLILLLAIAFAGFALFDILITQFIKWFPQYSYAWNDWAVGDYELSLVWLAIYAILFLGLFIATPSSHQVSNTEEGTQRSEVAGMVAVAFVLFAVLEILKTRMWFVSRMQVYFMFGYHMIVPEILPGIRLNAKAQMTLGVLLKVLLVAWGINVFRHNAHGILPYAFIWQ